MDEFYYLAEAESNLDLEYSIDTFNEAFNIHGFNWEDLFSYFIADGIGDFRILVESLSEPSLHEFTEQYNNNPDHIVNYAIWRSIEQKIYFLTQLDQFKPKFQDIFAGSDRHDVFFKNHWEYCIEYIDTTFGSTLSKLFIENYFSQNADNGVAPLFDNLKTSMMSMVSELSWLNQKEKDDTIAKIINITIGVGNISPDDDINLLRNGVKYNMVTPEKRCTACVTKLLRQLIRPLFGAAFSVNFIIFGT